MIEAKSHRIITFYRAAPIVLPLRLGRRPTVWCQQILTAKSGALMKSPSDPLSKNAENEARGKGAENKEMGTQGYLSQSVKMQGYGIFFGQTHQYIMWIDTLNTLGGMGGNMFAFTCRLSSVQTVEVSLIGVSWRNAKLRAPSISIHRRNKRFEPIVVSTAEAV